MAQNTLGKDPSFVPFASVPVWVARSAMTPESKTLFLILTSYADNTSRVAFPSRETLRVDMNVKDVKTVDRAMKALLDRGAVTAQARWRSKDRNDNSLSDVKTETHRLRSSTAYTLAWADPGVPPQEGVGLGDGGGDPTPSERTGTKPTDLNSSELVNSGCDCITHATQNGVYSERRLSEPPSLQGKTKDAQEEAVKNYIGTPPSCFNQQERKAWYAHEAHWAYPHGAGTYEKARRDIAWLWGVPVDSGMWEVTGWEEQVTQAQKAHSGLTDDGFQGQVQPQSMTRSRWALARLMADRMHTPEGWGFMGWDSYIEDPEYREVPWPVVRRPGTAA